jgi:hypothetical protein
MYCGPFYSHRFSLTLPPRFFLFCHDFRKINGQIKNFEKCTTTTVGTTPGAWFRRQGGAARRQDPTVERHGGSPYRRATRRQCLFFSFSFLKHF